MNDTIIKATSIVDTENTDNSIIVQATLINDDDLVKKSEIYSRSKTVKLLSMLDMIFLFINLIISINTTNFFWLFFLLFPMCFYGYKGSTEYKNSYICRYLSYLLIMVIYYFYLTFYYENLFHMLIFFIEIYIFSYTFKLYRLLSDSSEEIKESLRNGYIPTGVVVYYY